MVVSLLLPTTVNVAGDVTHNAADSRASLGVAPGNGRDVHPAYSIDRRAAQVSLRRRRHVRLSHYAGHCYDDHPRSKPLSGKRVALLPLVG